MSSDTLVANLALAKVGTRSTIASLNEASNEARAINLIYDNTRDQVLGMAFWNFARKTANLGVLKIAPGAMGSASAGGNVWSPDWPPPGWLYEYAYPSDCIQMRFVSPQFSNNVGVDGIPIFGNAVTSVAPYATAAARFEVATDNISGNQQSVILTNQYQAIGVYTLRVTNPDLWGAQFVEALAAAIGGRIAMQLTGDKQLAGSLFTYANAVILQARATDGNEGLTVQSSMPDWITDRDSGGYGNSGPWMAGFNPLFAV